MVTRNNAATRARVEVHLDAPELGAALQVGTLFPPDVRTDLMPSFDYAAGWLTSASKFLLDPRLELYEGEQHSPKKSGFGIFTDSAPDRWGRVLMERREALTATKENRTVQRFTDLDFMLGVHDFTRSGALRFRQAPNTPFVADERLAAPPLTSLRELAEAARRIDEVGAEHLPEYEKWLAMLIAPGSSLGGARPKANFTQPDGTLWLAKFPASDDRYDWGSWEYLVHAMARDAGIDVPLSERMSLTDKYHTFCVQRFDRGDAKSPQARRMYASAMTLLEFEDGQTGGSYLDLAGFLADNGGANLTQDLEQLFRRAVFNLLVGNRDDHLRNHGFVRLATGWRLSKAFDINPDPSKAQHALTWDGKSAEPNMATLKATAEFYRLTDSKKVGALIHEVEAVVSTWKERAKVLLLSGREIQLMERVFAV